MKRSGLIIALLIAAMGSRAQAQDTVEPVTPTNESPVTVTTPTNALPAPATTNEVTVPPVPVPTTTTNIPVKLKIPTGMSGAQMLGVFTGNLSGKYSVSGRTLKLPVPEATPRGEEDWRRTIDFAMNQSKGNSETMRYSLGLDATKEEGANVFRCRAKSAFGETDGTKDTENAFAGVRHEHLMTSRLYTLENLEWITDTIADLRYRVTGILSPSLRVIRTKESLFNLEIGAGYIAERKSDESDAYAAGRAAATVEKIITSHVLVWGTAEYLPKLSDPSIFLVNGETGIASYITRDLSLSVIWQERYDSTPVEGKKKSDSVLATALSLNF